MDWRAALLLAWLPASVSPPARAQDEAEEEELFEEEFELLQDENVVFSASRHQQQIQMSPAAVTVITRGQIETAAALSIVDIFRRVPGIEVITNSPAFTAVCARLPSTYENHLFLVLIDGRQANIELWGQAPWEIQPFSIDDIERIEIIRGPASALYGANAFAGVISITTRSAPKDTSAFAVTEGGTWSRTQAGGRISTNLGEVGFSASAAYELAGEFGDPRTLGKEVYKARGLVEYRLGQDTKLRLDVGGGHGEGPMPTSIGVPDGTLDLLAASLSAESGSLRAQVNYMYNALLADMNTRVEFGKMLLADFAALDIRAHDVDGQVQWTLPELWEPLVLITGGLLRGSFLDCPTCLDGSSYTDPQSSRYHQTGAIYRELRTGAFLHAELKPLERLLLSASGRLDYNTDTGLFLSPRLALVTQIASDHFLRLSVARAFRKPGFLERHMHPLVTFPEDSILQGGDQTLFLEFMSRLGGNPQLPNEKLWAFALGYELNAAGGKISLGLESYVNLYFDSASLITDIVIGPQGLPDLRASTCRYELDKEFFIAGVETNVKYVPLEWLTLRATWSYNAIWLMPGWRADDRTPKNLYSLGAEFSHPSGFLGSLYFFGRSRFSSGSINNPHGLLEPVLEQALGNMLLCMGRLGFRWRFPRVEFETGLKLALPIDLSTGRLRFYEHGGGITSAGLRYGGSEWKTTLLVYLTASL